MDFFKSVFSDDPERSDSPTSSPEPQHHEPKPLSPSSNPNPSPNPRVPSVANAWTLFRTLASKSESVIGTYRRDLEDFGSSLRKETSVIRELASRAVKELPASLDAGAAVAQKSLESVGEAVDNLGSTVTQIIAHGKDSILAAGDYDGENFDTKYNTSSQHKMNSKPYSRFDAQIRAIQCDMNTYCEEPGDLNEHNEWKLGFVLGEKVNEIDDLIEENVVIKEIYTEIVPSRVDHETFWSRYFFSVYKLKKAEEARAQLLKTAISGEEEEELTWDVDEDDYEETDESNLNKGRLNEIGSSGDKLGVKCGDKVSTDGNDNGGSCKDSDFSVVSSQNSPNEEELGWDEIEDVGSSDDNRVIRADLHRRLSVAEEEEELTWDIEDDDDEAPGL